MDVVPLGPIPWCHLPKVHFEVDARIPVYPVNFLLLWILGSSRISGEGPPVRDQREIARPPGRTLRNPLSNSRLNQFQASESRPQAARVPSMKVDNEGQSPLNSRLGR